MPYLNYYRNKVLTLYLIIETYQHVYVYVYIYIYHLLINSYLCAVNVNVNFVAP
jgi:hypothetical protein